MAYCNGNVDNLNTGQVTIKRGPKAGSQSNIYDISVDGTWYNCGFQDPKVVIGDEVSFNHEFNYGKNIADMVTFTKGSAPLKADSSQPAAPIIVSAGKVIDVAVSRERSIIRQNSLAHAVKAFEVIVGGGPVGHVDELVAERIIDMAYKFEEYSSGQREVLAAKALLDGS